MIAIGCATTDERAFRAAGTPTIEALDEGSSLLLRHHRYDSIHVPYNEMLDAAAGRDDLEAVFLVHQDALLDGDGSAVRAAVRGLLADPAVTVIGALDEASPRELPGVPGTLLVLSAWATRNLRFEPAAGASPDTSALDISMQARAAGRRVVGARLGVTRAWRPTPPAERRRALRSMIALRDQSQTDAGAQAS